ncbi:uncharacterized protein P174DRAFT_462730 [Aspergillus novofumigatus IBT 16806]|uniref:Uncharacterized protein n=1 Tax=Aspergillus novofumigatus (strain IBT 16806) TaxID=1392255 RepID=A0A2I1BYT6_ASPN1|nr:uncharacterized protein P174DRAFT_462730 [Aspergillus novofumigatus IBT 16806]PKX90535.1 hypothetical protein P174DRAFT_462730 [Aspergillus novofumigatus IBT 16806]
MRAASLSPNLTNSSPGIARRKLAARLTRAMSNSPNEARIRLKMARGAFFSSSTTVFQRHITDRSHQHDNAPNRGKRGQPGHELTDDGDEKANGAQEGKGDRLALLPIHLLGHLDDRFHVLHRFCNHEDGE